MSYSTKNSVGRRARSHTFMALAAVIASGAGCSVQSGAPSLIDHTETVGEMLSVPLTAPVLFDSHGTKGVTVAMVDEQAEIYVNAADSSLMVNGVQVVDKTVNPNVVAYAAGSKLNVKTIAVSDSTATTGDLVILNYSNGMFGQGTAGTVATTVSLTAGKANTFVIKGTSGVDNFAFGATGISLTNGAHTPVKDITTTNVATYSVYMGAGDDIFSAGGNAAVGGVFVNATGVAVFGGAGNDTLVEGAVPTAKETFSGGSGIDTVDYSARPNTNPVSVIIDAAGVMTSGDTPTTPGDPTAGATEGDIILDADVIKGSAGADFLMGGAAGVSVTLNGGPGNDTFCEGAALNSADTLVGGGGVDTVDYSKRVAALTVVMDGKTKSGGGVAGAEGDIIGTDVQNINLGVAGGTYTGNALNNRFVSNKACTGTSIIHGSTGDDTLDEGANANNGCNETFHGEGGIDTVDYSARTNPLHVTMDNTTPSGDTPTEGDLIDIDVENLYGGNKADTLVGNLLDNDIEGNGGGDTICGMAGNDTMVAFATVGVVGTAHLHGNDCADAVAESGAFNICLNTGTTGTPSTATLAGELAANCEVVGQ
jgi:hypothetical protein